MSTRVRTDDAVGCFGSFRAAMYDVADVKAQVAQYDNLSAKAKLHLTRMLCEPVAVTFDVNTTCIGLHQWIVSALDAGQTATAPDVVALGRSNTSPTETDTTLNDEVDRVSITQYEDESGSSPYQIRLTTFVGEGEANVDTGAGETISEGGFYADGNLLNHSLFSTEFEKDETKTMTVEGVLGFQAV